MTEFIIVWLISSMSISTIIIALDKQPWVPEYCRFCASFWAGVAITTILIIVTGQWHYSFMPFMIPATFFLIYK